MEGRGGHNTYPGCKDIPRSYPKEIAEAQVLELAESEGEKESVLPLFERKISDYKRLVLSSLQTNEMLKCRWKAYVNNIEGMKRYPFKFPKLCDLHFHNCDIKFMPSQTPKNRSNFRMQMGIGPGVDKYGQMPIPNDMHFSKSTNIKTKLVESSKGKQH